MLFIKTEVILREGVPFYFPKKLIKGTVCGIIIIVHTFFAWGKVSQPHPLASGLDYALGGEFVSPPFLTPKAPFSFLDNQISGSMPKSTKSSIAGYIRTPKPQISVQMPLIGPLQVLFGVCSRNGYGRTLVQ